MRLFKKKKLKPWPRKIDMNITKITVLLDGKDISQDYKGMVHNVEFNPDNSLVIHITTKL